MRAEVPVHEMAAADSRQVCEQGFFRAEGLTGRESCEASLRSAQVSMTRRAMRARWFNSRFAPSEAAVASALTMVSVMRRAGAVGLEDYPTTD